MSDEALDREIAAALNVEASPAFVAGVRHRIAHEPVPSGWRQSWSAGAAASLALAVVAGMIFWIESSGPRRGVARDDRPSRQLGFIESRTIAGISELQTDRRSGRLPSSRHHVHGSSMVQPSTVVSGFSRTTPEILIDVREANALRALFAGASLGTVDLIPLASAAGKAAHELTPPAEIVIAPLTIQPIAPVAGEGARP